VIQTRGTTTDNERMNEGQKISGTMDHIEENESKKAPDKKRNATRAQNSWGCRRLVTQ